MIHCSGGGGGGGKEGKGVPEPVLRWKVALVAIRKQSQKCGLCFIHGEREREWRTERERVEDRETETERETQRDTHRENRDKSMVLSPGFVKIGAPACELENR